MPMSRSLFWKAHHGRGQPQHTGSAVYLSLASRASRVCSSLTSALRPHQLVSESGQLLPFWQRSDNMLTASAPLASRLSASRTVQQRVQAVASTSSCHQASVWKSQQQRPSLQVPRRKAHDRAPVRAMAATPFMTAFGGIKKRSAAETVRSLYEAVNARWVFTGEENDQSHLTPR